MRSGVQLITYADRLGRGDLTTINDLLQGPLAGAFTGVHLLPFYLPFDGADAGFDPVNHTSVDPRLGDWDSVRRIAESHDVMADLIANHISDESPQFLDFLANGDESEYADMFLTPASVFPDGYDQKAVADIYRPRPGAPFTDKTLSDGSARTLWTTFTPHQIDLNVADHSARRYLIDVLDQLAAAGVSSVRLDAIGYAIKTPGTSCFMTAETIEFIKYLAAEVRSRSMESLLEIHSFYADQVEASTITDWVYDFALPPLLLHAIYTGHTGPLRGWLKMSPRNAITVLDTHDGIGVIDVGPDGQRPGLLTPTQIDELVEGIHLASRGESLLATGAGASNLDLYQVNCTFFSALAQDEDSYLLARLAQFLAPGLPQVYYAGLFAAKNDMALLKQTGVGRDINRPYYSPAEIAQELDRPVVRRQLALARFRSAHPAFGGDFTLEPCESHELVITRSTDEASITARLDFRNISFVIEERVGSAGRTITGWDGFHT